MKDLKGEILKQLDKDFPNVEKWKYESYVSSMIKVVDSILSQQRKEVLKEERLKYIDFLERELKVAKICGETVFIYELEMAIKQAKSLINKQ